MLWPSASWLVMASNSINASSTVHLQLDVARAISSPATKGGAALERGNAVKAGG